MRGPCPKPDGDNWKIGILYSKFWADTDNDIKTNFTDVVNRLSNDALFDIDVIDDQLLEGYTIAIQLSMKNHFLIILLKSINLVIKFQLSWLI